MTTEAAPPALPGSPRRTAVGAVTQLGTSVSVNLGSALAGLVIPVVGVFVVVAVRQLVMAAVVLPIYRPTRAHLTFRRLWPALLLGVAMAVMNLSFYEAVHLLGLGIAATIEFLGPLAVALVASRRVIDVVCALVAGAGVFVLTGFDGTMNVWGVVLALVAAGAWAAYILLTRRVALRLPGLEGLTVATIVSLALLLPFAVITLDVSQIDWRVLGILVGVGLLSSAIPYSLDTFVLRRITPRLYAIITASGPVVAALFGVLILGEHLTPVEVLAIVIVCGAAATAIATQRDRPRPTVP
ncbi:EamA family transporter [Herbiconiux liukaitaii]|uniref:EamA family transporter n=1 Tax=Herbiconiux liukaitaii TaxID=3342799 RepID=UPI0035B920F6